MAMLSFTTTGTPASGPARRRAPRRRRRRRPRRGVHGRIVAEEDVEPRRARFAGSEGRERGLGHGARGARSRRHGVTARGRRAGVRGGHASSSLVRREPGDEEESVAHLRGERLARDGERDLRPVIVAGAVVVDRRPGAARRHAAGDAAQHLHVCEDAVQLPDQLRDLLGREAEPREGRHMPYVGWRDHQPIPRSRPAYATTSRLRPMASSSKSIVTLASRPRPDSSAMVPLAEARVPHALARHEVREVLRHVLVEVARRCAADGAAGTALRRGRPPLRCGPRRTGRCRSARAPRAAGRCRAAAPSRARRTASDGRSRTKLDESDAICSPFRRRVRAWVRNRTSSARVMPT